MTEPTAPLLTLVGDPDAAVCVDGVCAIPQAPAAPRPGAVAAATGEPDPAN